MLGHFLLESRILFTGDATRAVNSGIEALSHKIALTA